MSLSTDRPVATGTGLTAVALGGLVANAAGYLLQLAGGRWLGVAGYGGFASLLAVQLLLAVPALAVQNVVAREIVLGAAPGALRRLVDRCAWLVAAAALALILPLAAVLQVDGPAAAAALLAAPALVVLAGEQGRLQGRQRFRTLALLLAAAGLAKLPAIAVLALGANATAALVAGAAATALVAATARTLGANDGDRGDGGGGDRSAAGTGVVAVLRASQVQLALIALSSLDLIAAKVLLGDADSSRYALGAVAAKIAFWLPQAVGVVFYPRMAHPGDSGRAVRTALAVLAGLGAATVAAAALAAPLAPVLVGADYAPVQGLLWVFALDGACLAVLQGALLAAIAAERTWIAAVAWLALPLGLGGAALFADTVGRLIVVVTTIVAGAAALSITAALSGASARTKRAVSPRSSG